MANKLGEDNMYLKQMPKSDETGAWESLQWYPSLIFDCTKFEYLDEAFSEKQ